MKLARNVAFCLSVVGTSVFAVACGGTVEHAPQTSASAGTRAPVAAASHGVVKLVGNALGDVPLRAEQRTEIEKLAVEAEARHAPTTEGRKDLIVAFADQVERGAIDRVALQPKIDKVTADLVGVRAGDRAALVKLHGVLDSEQRGLFVDALEAKMKAKHGEHAHGGFGKLKVFAEELKLTEAQRSQIVDRMRQAHEDAKDGKGRGHDRAGRGHRGGKKALEAFREDTLDLEKMPLGRAGEHEAGVAADRAIGFAEKILPILTPEQRKLAADKLRAMAASDDAALLAP